MWGIWAKRPSLSEARILRALVTGWSLKSHRDLDGAKVYCLHAYDGAIENISKRQVVRLRRRGLIVSNQKFPAATYVLTESGKGMAIRLEAVKFDPCFGE